MVTRPRFHEPCGDLPGGRHAKTAQPGHHRMQARTGMRWRIAVPR